MNFRFSFKLAVSSQQDLIHRWLSEPHIKEWIHGQGLQNTLSDLEAFFLGRSILQHWIAYDQETPFAYLLTSDSPDEENAITLDLFICDKNYLGKGLAVQMIREFIVSQFPNKRAVLIDPEASNTRAIHVYEKAGFRTIGTFIAPWHPVPHLQMRLEVKK